MVAMTDDGAVDGRRRAFRAFVLAHHPDRGGDPDVFAAGVEAYRSGADPGPAVDDPRYDAEIVFYRPPRGAMAIVHRVRRRWRRRRHPRVS